MAATTQKESKIEGSTDLHLVPCGHHSGAANVSPFEVAYLAPSPSIDCGSCGKASRPLWWGICAWCGAEEEEFEEAA